MVAIGATNSATPSLQSVLGRARVEQARREADQAEANAQTLRQQADQGVVCKKALHLICKPLGQIPKLRMIDPIKNQKEL